MENIRQNTRNTRLRTKVKKALSIEKNEYRKLRRIFSNMIDSEALFTNKELMGPIIEKIKEGKKFIVPISIVVLCDPSDPKGRKNKSKVTIGKILPFSEPEISH